MMRCQRCKTNIATGIFRLTAPKKPWQRKAKQWEELLCSACGFTAADRHKFKLSTYQDGLGRAHEIGHMIRPVERCELVETCHWE